MLNEVQNTRLYLPAEDPEAPNERIAVHPETNSSQVLMSADGMRLEKFLGPQIVISAEKPERNNMLWGKITATRIVTV